MTRRLLAALAAAAGLAVPVAAWADIENRPVEEKNLERGKQTIAPDKGYIYLHAPSRTTMVLIKEPTADETAAFEEEWQAEFAKARDKYPRRLRTWAGDVEYAREHGNKAPEKPIEPTEANFSIGRLEIRMIVSVGPQYIYAKQDEEFAYLHELEPGTYRYYGPITFAPNGVASGICACMGSVKFEVRPGLITNLGDFLVGGMASFDSAGYEVGDRRRLVDYALPGSLAAIANQQADWRAAGKIDNLYGIIIGRMSAIPGVLDYERDTVVDLRAAAEPQ